MITYHPKYGGRQKYHFRIDPWTEFNLDGCTPIYRARTRWSLSTSDPQDGAIRMMNEVFVRAHDLTGVSGEFRFDTYPSEDAVPRFSSTSLTRLVETGRHYWRILESLGDNRLGELMPRLHANSFDQLKKYDGNLLVLLSKLSGMGLTSLSSLADFADSGLSLASLSSTYLATRYGDRLSIGGFADLVKSIDDHLLTLRGEDVGYVVGRHRILNDRIATDLGPMTGWYASNVAVEPEDANGLMTAVRNLYEWGGYPTLSNVWDAIPLSFVVDWLVNVGDIFSSIDRMVYSRYYRVVSILNSYKIDMINSFFPGIKMTLYKRSLDTSLHLGVSGVELGLPPILNIIDSAALLAG
jgi:hypothetical protein